eukprot:SAG31_NODE_541_length_14275_cov_6.690886_1_plen_49_part_00
MSLQIGKDDRGRAEAESCASTMVTWGLNGRRTIIGKFVDIAFVGGATA